MKKRSTKSAAKKSSARKSAARKKTAKKAAAKRKVRKTTGKPAKKGGGGSPYFSPETRIGVGGGGVRPMTINYDDDEIL